VWGLLISQVDVSELSLGLVEVLDMGGALLTSHRGLLGVRLVKLSILNWLIRVKSSCVEIGIPINKGSISLDGRVVLSLHGLG